MAGNDGDEAVSNAGITGINVTPLVDITLVLLIVFMVTAKLVASQAITMDVPRQANAAPAATQLTLAVGVSAAGALTLDGAAIADDASLEKAARARAPTDAAAAHAVIAASRSSSHGAVIGAIDALRSAGITKIAFATPRD